MQNFKFKKLIIFLNEAWKSKKTKLEIKAHSPNIPRNSEENSPEFQFLQMLCSRGVITDYCFTKQNRHFVLSINLRPVLFKITYFKKLYVNKRSLNKLLLNNPSSNFFLNTTSGFLHHKEALRLNNFGHLVISVKLL